MRGKLSFAILAVLLSCSAQAAVYKIVGPDGKITYSDHPPDTPDARYDLVGKAAPARDELAAKASSGDAPAAVVRTLGDKTPVQSKKVTSARFGSDDKTGVQAVAATQPVDAAPAAPAPSALEGAIIGVLGIEDIVRQTEDICVKTLPTSFARYSQAATEWRQRNRVVVMQAHHAIAQGFNAGNGVDVEQRIENAIRAKNQGMFAPIQQASVAERIRWCDNSVDEIHGGSMDFAGKPKLTEPLRGYR